MSQIVKGIIARAQGEPVEMVDIVVPDPIAGEAVVAIQACGVCHTDLHYREGGINDEFPFLLGHEAAGIVEAIGAGVTEVAVGDFVILNWRAVCGECRSCLRGNPHICFNTHNATQKMTLDGVELSPALGIGAFAAAITDAIGLNDLKVQVSVLAAATLISFFLLRPVLKRWLLSKGDDTNVDALAGREGSVTKQIEAGGFGDVRVGSEIWRAETADGSALEKGSRVRVAQVEGNRVIVEKIS